MVLLRITRKRLKDKIPVEHQGDVLKFIKENTYDKPTFNDYLESGLKLSGFSDKDKKFFRTFLMGYRYYGIKPLTLIPY